MGIAQINKVPFLADLKAACHQVIFALLALTSCLTAEGKCPSIPTIERFELRGDTLLDKSTGLEWARCAVGQVWSGEQCMGDPLNAAMTFMQALAYAKDLNGWRLPTVKELSSLADKGCISPAIDGGAFPNFPSRTFWSSTPFVGDGRYSFAVLMHYGDVVRVAGVERYLLLLIKAK